MLALRGWTARCASPGAHRDWRRLPTRCRPPKSSDGPAKWSPCWSARARGRRGAGHRTVRLAASGGGGSNRRLRFGGGRGGRGSGDGGGLGEGALAVAGGRGGGGGRGRHCLGDRGGRSQRGLAHAGLGRRDGRRHGQRRLAALPSHRRPNPERDARIGGHRPLLRAATAPAAAATGSTRTPRASRKPSLSNRSEPAPSGGRARAGSSPRPSASTGATAGRWPRRPSTPFVRQANLKLPNV